MREPTWKSYAVLLPEPILTPEQCEKIIRIGQTQPQTKGGLMKGPTPSHTIDYTYRKSTISWIPFDLAPEIYGIIFNGMATTNTNFFAFDDMQMNEPGQYAEYSKGDFYDWHIDIGVNMAPMPMVRKISMSILLNDPKEFEGGEVEIFGGKFKDDTQHEHVQKLKQGQALFFASFFLHRVNTVTEGNRKALVMWFGGTPFK